VDDHRVVIEVVESLGAEGGLGDPGVGGDEGEHVGLDDEVPQQQLTSLLGDEVGEEPDPEPVQQVVVGELEGKHPFDPGDHRHRQPAHHPGQGTEITVGPAGLIRLEEGEGVPIEVEGGVAAKGTEDPRSLRLHDPGHGSISSSWRA
jgi:hypothetical protein